MEKLLLLSSFTIMLTWMVPGSCSQTNIVLIIADDQDLILGGLTPMVKTQNIIANMGVTFTNAFVTTPICCPSRASIFSGQYQHNHLTLNNSVSGGCSGPHWQQRVEPQTWPAILHQAGYTTFYAGKYLNQYGYKKTGGVAHVPPGWDWWIGLVGNSRYYNYTLSVNGTSVFHSDDYFTNLIDKHWLLRMSPSPLPDSMLPELDRVYRQRWETLLSVDDLVESIVIELYSLGLLDNTYLIVTSDHGYHVGQFGLPWDKRQPYEMDIRIPLMMRGPGLPRKQKDVRPVLNIDFAPTFLAMAGLEPPAWMDGLPFFPLLQQNANNGTKIDRKFLIEYHGEGSMKTISSDCPSDYSDTLSTCVPEQMCKCQDSKNNSYTCVRHLEDLISNHNFSYDFIFCKFRDSENFTEAYDLNVDPYQLNNLAPYLSSIIENKYITWLDHLKFCSGLTCHMYHDLNVQNSP
ncbi:N-acetylglucosamine-6-sulfatase-like isoform X3 [Zootermopsis nevadensis]|uniref:N-acetylglucosamine-6-sulfatase-like isoform X3 n=1 Tax=Zootermopsis nevadensis TaxID=136037 RepID=UPI000B8EC74E|nr:N-acetylglucosamine-6-sulfatase-like isoform X3 [Zootermopsis nevadensis]